MKNTHLPEESKNSASGIPPAFSHRNPEFSGQPNQPTKPEFTQTFCFPENTDKEDDRERMLSGRERLKRHREEVAGKVSIPENWGREGLLENLMDFSAFDSAFTSTQILTARAALMADSGRGVCLPSRLRIHSSC